MWLKQETDPSTKPCFLQSSEYTATCCHP